MDHRRLGGAGSVVVVEALEAGRVVFADGPLDAVRWRRYAAGVPPTPGSSRLPGSGGRPVLLRDV